MSITDQLAQLQDLSKRFVRQLVELPVQHLLGVGHSGARRPPGTVPGTLFIDPDATPTRLTAVCFRGTEVETLTNPDLAALQQARARSDRIWLDVTGFGSDRMLKDIGREFELHPMMLADLVNREPQTKTDSANGVHLVVTQVPLLDPDSGQPGLDTLGLALGKNWLLSFRERQSGLFLPIYERIENPESRLRTDPLDYLTYALLDVAIDSLFPVLETIAARIDQSEDQVLEVAAAKSCPKSTTSAGPSLPWAGCAGASAIYCPGYCAKKRCFAHNCASTCRTFTTAPPSCRTWSRPRASWQAA